MPSTKPNAILHGSFRRHFDLIQEVHQLFTSAGITVIAPELSAVVGETGGFVHLVSDKSKDPRVVELLYLQKLAALGSDGFSYYVNPQGKLGVSASYELAVDQLTNTRTFFMEKLVGHPAYVPENSVWKPQELAAFISENGHYPPPVIPQDEKYINDMLCSLIIPGSLVAVGGIIVDYSSKRYKSMQEREILLVKTHKWGNRFSVVGGKVRRKERLAEALKREICEETGLEAEIAESICTFDEIKGSGYYQEDIHRIFTDNVVHVQKRRATLNEEAEDYIWIPPTVALRELLIEPNARRTVETYTQRHLRVA